MIPRTARSDGAVGDEMNDLNHYLKKTTAKIEMMNRSPAHQEEHLSIH